MDPVQSTGDLGNGYVVQIRGTDSDIITFAYGGTVIAHDLIRDGNGLEPDIDISHRQYTANDGSPIYFICVQHGRLRDLFYCYAINSKNEVYRSNLWRDAEAGSEANHIASDVAWNDNKTGTAVSGGGMTAEYNRGIMSFDEASGIWNYQPFDGNYNYSPGPATFGPGGY